jgi:molybdenum cofactor cytidylyltransferase
MGQLKQLLPLRGKPMMRHSLDTLLSSGIRDIIVVLNRADSPTVTAVKGLSVRMVFNPVPGSDMAESLRTGLRVVAKSSGGVLISLADQPLVSVETIKHLIALHEREPDMILIPQYEIKKGHPVLLPKDLLEYIFYGGTLRDVIKKYPGRVRLLPVMDEGVVLDIDTMDDYKKILTMGEYSADTH